MAESIVTPAIRTPLLALDDPTGGRAGRTPLRTPAPTTKDWWLYWDALTRGANQAVADIDSLEAEVAALAAQLDATIRAGTHAERLAEAPAPPEALWIETDRGNVIYQAQLVAGVPAWVYVTGTMYGTISPDQRPTDLGVNDHGFHFSTGVAPVEEFIWSGTAWIDITPAAPLPPESNTAQVAYASVPLTLTTSAQNVPGCSLTLAKAGKYLIQGVFDFVSANDGSVYLIGGLSGFAKAALFMTTTAGGRGTVAQQWVITVSAGAVAQLEANKTGGTGTSQAADHTSISATWIGP